MLSRKEKEREREEVAFYIALTAERVRGDDARGNHLVNLISRSYGYPPLIGRLLARDAGSSSANERSSFFARRDDIRREKYLNAPNSGQWANRSPVTLSQLR